MFSNKVKRNIWLTLAILSVGCIIDRAIRVIDGSVSMQCVEHVAAQRIAILRVQKPENAPFLPSENRFLRPSRACVFVPDKCLQVIREWA